jgi:hypothetical protein
MKIAPFIDPNGIARERAAYRVELITERERFLNCLSAGLQNSRASTASGVPLLKR